MSSKAPTLNKMAISPQQPGLGQQHPTRPPGPGQPTTAERDRVAAAVEFGAALEDLVAYARLRQEEPNAVPQTSGPRFPPDLFPARPRRPPSPHLPKAPQAGAHTSEARPTRRDDAPMVRVSTTRDDFLPNVDELKIERLMPYFARAEGV